MKKRQIKFFFFLLFTILFWVIFSFFSRSVSAPHELTKPTVTVINPIRGSQLGLETADLLTSLQSQYSVTRDAGINATWLWQYSAMEEKKLIDFAKQHMKEQEFGLFLEIDRNTAAKADVVYRGRGPWYFSDGIFLNAYDIGERRKLIDTIFGKFKTTFSYYPKTVGAWWIGADSLQYMHEKYGVIASLQVADQFGLDVYTVWGAPWSIPYLASKENAAVPAGSPDDSLGVVIMQWAPRDPVYGYGNTAENSTYSLQDYSLKKYDHTYVDYLSDIFLNKPGDQIVLGLESGSSAEGYKIDYKQRLERIKGLQEKNHFSFQTADKFAAGFLARKQIFINTPYFLSNGYESTDQSFWFNSQNYRAGIVKKGKDIFLVDLRDYTKAIPEEFSFVPNSQGHLRIQTKAIIDSAHLPQSKLLLASSEQPLKIKEHDGNVLLETGSQELAFFTPDGMNLLTKQKFYSFYQPVLSINIFGILFIILLMYTFLIFFISRDIKITYLHGALLFVCLLIAHPFLSYGTVDGFSYLFDKKQFPLFPLLTFLPNISPWGIIFLFQIVPFLLLIIFHYLFLIKKKNIPVFCISLFIFLLLYCHVPEFFVTEFFTKKTKFVGFILVLFTLLSAIIIGFSLYKKRWKNVMKIGIIFFIGGTLLICTLLFSWKKFIISPFEMESLQTIANMGKNVIVILPNEEPVYRAVEPLLLHHYKYGASLTKVNWVGVSHPKDHSLTIDNVDKVIVFVPRYLGAELYTEEREKYKLQKFFDNAQIELYSR